MKTLKGLLNLTRISVRWIVLLIIILAIAYGYYVLFVANPYTTDAYVQANWQQVAARVEGPIVKLYVQNNQHIIKGQALFQIDPTDFALNVKKAAGDLQYINQKLYGLQQGIQVAVHLIEEKEARLRFAILQLQRMQKLVTTGAISVEHFNSAQANFASYEAERKQAIHTLERLKYELGSLNDNGQKKAAEAALALAEKNLSYTTVRAPVSGTISSLFNRVGDYIQIGKPLFSIVEDDYWWIQANYLEYELRRLRRGQKAKIVVASYPRHVFDGEVTAIDAGISRGRVVSPVNTLQLVSESINWMRLFSRIPVYIRIINVNSDYPLRVGSTAAVTIHVR